MVGANFVSRSPNCLCQGFVCLGEVGRWVEVRLKRGREERWEYRAREVKHWNGGPVLGRPGSIMKCDNGKKVIWLTDSLPMDYVGYGS